MKENDYEQIARAEVARSATPIEARSVDVPIADGETVRRATSSWETNMTESAIDRLRAQAQERRSNHLLELGPTRCECRSRQQRAQYTRSSIICNSSGDHLA